MDFQEIEDEALHLPKQERVHLMQRLVLSLDTPSSDDLLGGWLAEARRRAEELDNASVQPVSGQEVLRKAQALIK